MARYVIRWGEQADRTYNDLPPRLQKAVDKRLDELRVEPYTGTYDKGRDQWKAAFDGGIVMYTVGERMLLIDVLRITAL
ncbi:hypothetical protein SAMN04487905_101277 [Actinopolyspora xinjiangensis]|uniref:mRNA interferase RelE/StbE n=1 Tax=Actinopolyspora xinjiangensis TaxID=405564 RepID=A0A1H0NW19_9ACTN|nr:hypothetical protein [Actinopolyspora xinjiangensis]SDO96718.1 hypothetical protein SAMN04487905_101277 [Actinopolyspora xinjiangensis]